jgi:hypothetical protein
VRRATPGTSTLNVVGYFSLVSLEIWGGLFIRRESIETFADMIGMIEHKRNRRSRGSFQALELTCYR